MITRPAPPLCGEGFWYFTKSPRCIGYLARMAEAPHEMWVILRAWRGSWLRRDWAHVPFHVSDQAVMPPAALRALSRYFIEPAVCLVAGFGFFCLSFLLR